MGDGDVGVEWGGFYSLYMFKNIYLFNYPLWEPNLQVRRCQ